MSQSHLYTGMDEVRFRQQVDQALKSITKVLDNTKTPNYPDRVLHDYEDKYTMVNNLTNNLIISTLNCLYLLGMDKSKLAQMKEFGKRHSVTLRFASRESCWFSKKIKRTVESPKTVTTVKVLGIGGSLTQSEKTVVKDYYWMFAFDYELFAYYRNKPEEKISLSKRRGECEVKYGSSKRNGPYLNSHITPFDINITWLLNQVDEKTLLPDFHIDRSSRACHTPRRNPEMFSTLEHCAHMFTWLNNVTNYFINRLYRIPSHDYNITKYGAFAQLILVPSVPIFLEPKEDIDDQSDEKSLIQSNQKQSVHLSPFDNDAILSEEMRALKETFAELEKMFPFDIHNNSVPIVVPPKLTKEEKKSKNYKKIKYDGNPNFKDSLIVNEDAKILVILLHMKHICQYYNDGVEYVEHMLRTQLIDAIGKEVGPIDFYKYMEFHNRRLYKQQYQNPPFSHAVRQPDHFPEGEISIECNFNDGTAPQPIRTICSRSQPTEPMYFKLDASTKVGFLGDRYLHGYVGHQFAGQSSFSLTLNARTRQFSSFILMLGSIGGVDVFYPKHAIILQNKDELCIPLDIETIPPPKEFAARISSISPEQQRFAKAMRSMQLAGSLFGILVIHIKPQLEKLLRVPSDGLIKEIRLTQDLLGLFTQYNIPSDLLSFGGRPFLQSNHKIDEVKRHVEEMHDLIDEIKEYELKGVLQERIFENAFDAAIDQITGSSRGSQFFVQPSSSLPQPSVQPSLPQPSVQPQPSVPAPIQTPTQKSSEKQSDQVCNGERKKSSHVMKNISDSKAEREECAPRKMDIQKNVVMKKSIMKEKDVKEKKKLKKMDYEDEDDYYGGKQKRNYRSISPIRSLSEESSSISSGSSEAAAIVKKELSPAEKRALKQKERDIAQGKQDEEELRLSLIQVPQEVFTEVVSVSVPKVEARDYTVVPGKLDESFEALDDDNSLCTTTLKAEGKIWSKKYRESLLAAEAEKTLTTELQKEEKKKAYDLLDALSKSGTILIDNSSLHIVCAATHCFGENLMDTVIKANVNPIEKVERSQLIMASVIHEQPAELLVDQGTSMKQEGERSEARASGACKVIFPKIIFGKVFIKKVFYGSYESMNL